MSKYSDWIIADGASNYWRLGETSGLVAVDSVGGANGTISGGVTLNQPGATVDGNTAMTFNGIAGAKVATAATVTLPVGCTIEAWMKDATSAGQRPIFCLRPEATVLIATKVASQQMMVYNGAFAYGAKTVTDGAWHHIAVVFTGTQCLIYVDGALDTTTAMVFTASTGPARIGYDAADNLSWSGSLDDVSIYPRALTAVEIAAHYTIGTQPSGQVGGEDVASDTIAQYNFAFPVVPHDSIDFPRGPSDALFVGGAGIVVGVFEGGQTASFSCIAGQILPIKFRRVNAASTTATLMNSLYRI